MRFYRTPPLLQRVFPNFTWHRNVPGKQIFLTFDDGPIPEVTEFALQQLSGFNAKATFLCVGENIEKHPEIARQILAQGHKIGNHTHNHLNGWKTSQAEYLANTQKCLQALKNIVPEQNSQRALFRPPYGKITRKQAQELNNEYDIIMWDVLSYDFDAALSPELCLKKTIEHAKPGSVIVFHDSQKARRNMEFALPRFLHHFSNLGFTFSTL